MSLSPSRVAARSGTLPGPQQELRQRQQPRRHIRRPRRATRPGRCAARHRSDRRSRRWRRIAKDPGRSPALQQARFPAHIERPPMGEITRHHRVEQDFGGVEQRRIGQPLRQRRPRHRGEGVEAGQRRRGFPSALPARALASSSVIAAQLLGQTRPPVQPTGRCRPAAARDCLGTAHQPSMAAMLAGQHIQDDAASRHGGGRTSTMAASSSIPCSVSSLRDIPGPSVRNVRGSPPSPRAP